MAQEKRCERKTREYASPKSTLGQPALDCTACKTYLHMSPYVVTSPKGSAPPCAPPRETSRRRAHVRGRLLIRDHAKKESVFTKTPFSNLVSVDDLAWYVETVAILLSSSGPEVRVRWYTVNCKEKRADFSAPLLIWVLPPLPKSVCVGLSKWPEISRLLTSFQF